jgi:hypothetical protein
MMRVWGGVLVATLLALGCGSSSSNPTDNGGDTGDVGEGGGDNGEGGEGVDGDVHGDGDVHPDGDVGDGDGDVGDGADAPAAKHTVIAITAGGGAVTSTNYQLKISVGAPQPMGAGTSGTRDLRVGPGAVVNQ